MTPKPTTMTVLEASKILGSNPTYLCLLLRMGSLKGTKNTDGEWQIDAAAVAERAARKK